MNQLSVLLVDDETRILNELREFLENAGYRVLIADRPSVALGVLAGETVDIAVVDVRLPEYSGLELIKKINEQRSSVELVVMSGHGDMETVIEALRLGAFDYLRKPFSVFELQSAIGRISRLVSARRAERRYAGICAELNRERAGEHALLGVSSLIDSVRRRIGEAAGCDVPVLIHGESGTGKELAARQIHAESRRASGRFVALNCAAIPRDLFESELFGHRGGAFTDARTARDGLFMTADGGTLFLDEIGELAPEAQAKLLRVIESGSFRPVGADDEHCCNVRILCATNRDLQSAADQGIFRKDLYYRIAVLELELPPLRDRKEDIPLLAQHFLASALPPHRRDTVQLSGDVLTEIASLPLNGNVRELKNLMERAAIHALTENVDLIRSIPGMYICRGSAVLPQNAESQPTSFNLDQLERTAIINALECSNGVLTHAAALLGISRQALDRRLERYGLRQ